MKFKRIVLVVAGSLTGLAVIAAGPALAQVKHHSKHASVHVGQRQCVDRQSDVSLGDWLFASRPAPQWNGCSPPVYSGGYFVGQDPDPNVRQTLRRDPEEGYHMFSP